MVVHLAAGALLPRGRPRDSRRRPTCGRSIAILSDSRVFSAILVTGTTAGPTALVRWMAGDAARGDRVPQSREPRAEGAAARATRASVRRGTATPGPPRRTAGPPDPDRRRDHC